jgi:hypothetical protein
MHKLDICDATWEFFEQKLKPSLIGNIMNSFVYQKLRVGTNIDSSLTAIVRAAPRHGADLGTK